VKFLCDRCKTRYSIGDERVRGKILKIRCKTCSNVITVREGMIAEPEAEAVPPATPEYPGRAKKVTTIAPKALSEASEASDPARAAKEPGRSVPGGDPARSDLARPPGSAASPGEGLPRGARPGGAGQPGLGARDPAGPGNDKPAAPGAAQAKRSGPSEPAGRVQPGAGRRGPGPAAPRGEPNALNAAFASAMAKPPPALEEEWYVSIDGDQSGPFSLAEAQGWVAQKAFDAELHCWSEGFDDWLPVDKVSHFRGLRKRPATPTRPPALPRPGGLPQRAAAPAPAEADPKPLFAATMASLERGAPAAGNRGLPVPPPPGTLIPPRHQPGTKSPNGARVVVRDGDNGARPAPVTPVLARPEDARRPIARPAVGPAGAPPPGAGGNPFDTGEASDTGEAQTQIEAMPFADSILEPRRPTPAVVGEGPSPGSSDAALTSPHLPAAATLPGGGTDMVMTTGAVSAAASALGDEGEELAIGEVSRVVKLADLSRTPRTAERPGATRRPGTAPGAAGQQPIVRSTSSFMAVLPGPASDAAPDALGEGDPSLTLAPMRTSHRRGLIALLSVAGVMVLGVVGAVILLVTTNDDSTGSSLGPVRDIDTSRPEDPITHRPIDPTGSAGPTIPPPNPFVPRPPPHPRPNPPVGSNRDPDPLPGNSLRGDEIEDVARKHQDMTQRCYMRSQRGVDSILVGDVKKIAVTLMIDKDGNVSEVQLSDHAADNLGKCLAGSIRGWKFRTSPGGTFRFSLNFVSG
jgi:predicted Zn finger-like uncharacterized protein